MLATPSSRARRAGVLATALAVAATAVASAAPSTSDLQQRIDSTHQREQGVQGTIQRENGRIARYQGQIDDINARLDALEQQLAIERTQLEQTERQLRVARGRLMRLQATLRSDRAALARQLVAQYEAPPDDIVTVVLHAHGFTDLIERMDDMSRLRKNNEQVTTRVGVARAAVAVQARQLATLAARRRRIANGTARPARRGRTPAPRCRPAAVADRARALARPRPAVRAAAARASLQGTLQKIQAREAAANAVPTSGTLGGPGPGVTNTPFAAHGGSTGFFQAPGTNYAQGVEPIIAARLDRLGKALGLHLIGISGYRTPQHSIEVGGFADDPHTRGEASDTPGVEGVSEATLEQFGLTRPFGGAAEADHIQLLGSA